MSLFGDGAGNPHRQAVPTLSNEDRTQRKLDR
jgi:hypothetical protein